MQYFWKRWLWIGFVLMNSLHLAGCSSSAPTDAFKTNNYQVIYKIYEKNNNERNIHIEYPWLLGGKNTENQDKAAMANQIIWDTLLRWLRIAYGEAGSPEAPFTLIMKSQVYDTEDGRLSVVATRVGYVWGQPYPHNWLVSVNINLAAGRRIWLADLYSIDEGFVHVFRQWAQKQWMEEPERLAWLQEQPDALLLNLIRRCDDFIGGSYSFQNNTDVAVILPAPHTLGDYLVVMLPLEAVAEFSLEI